MKHQHTPIKQMKHTLPLLTALLLAPLAAFAAPPSPDAHIVIASKAGAKLDSDVTKGGGTNDTALIQSIPDRSPKLASPLPQLEPRQYSPVVPFALERLPSACIEPEGRWKRILRVIADSWILRAAQTKHSAFYSFLWERDWTDPMVAYDSAQNIAYLASAYVRLANYLPDSKLANLYYSDWLPKTLQSQMPNGYIGSGQVDGIITILDMKKGTKIPRYELVSCDKILEFLMRQYEFQGDPDVLQAAKKLGDFVIREYMSPESYDSKTMETPHHQAIVRSLTELYRYTGDEKILTALNSYISKIKNSLKDLSSNKRPHIHAVCVSEMLQAPVIMYHYSGDKDLKEIATSSFDNVSGLALQTTGAITGCEITLEKGYNKYTEHCAVVEWANACIYFLQSQGEVRVADIVERNIHNAYFGSKSPDGLSLGYFHTLNQLFATDRTAEYLRDYEPSGIFRGDYDMDHSPQCCNAYTSKCFPVFVENATMKTPEGELTFVFYGPNTTRTSMPDSALVQIRQETDYPYEDVVRFKISTEKPSEFPLRFRIPTWCKTARLLINGKPVSQPIVPGTFARVERKWNDGDEVHLEFDFPITLDWDHSPSGKGAAAVVRGPLVYALPVKADWNYVGKEPPSPENMREKWNLTMADDAIWNIALDIDKENPGASVKPVKLIVPPDTLPWQYSPIGMQVQARLLPDWTLDRISNNPTTPALPRTINPQGKSFPVTLIPFGFTQLRMTVLPIISQETKEKSKTPAEKKESVPSNKKLELDI